ncbi:MAG: MFS transporter [bacterium]
MATTLTASAVTSGDDTIRAERPKIMSPALVMLFIAALGAMTSFYLLLSVVPQYATSVGAGGIGAGLSTGALMLATVLTELVVPRIAARFGYRIMFGAGLLLLGIPALVLPYSTSMIALLTVCAIRGVGFAILVVIGSALVASLVPAERRGEGLGLYGAIVGVPAIVALPLGVWLVAHIGFSIVFVIGGVSALAGLAAVPGLPARTAKEEEPVGMLAALKTPALVRPAALFALTAMATGVVVTFLPLAIAPAAGNLVALALLAHAAASTFTRWLAGRVGDHHGAGRLLIPAIATAAVGVMALAFTSSDVAIMGGMLLLGVGFGVAQNASLALMFDQVSASGYDTVSALWNIAYDSGLGIGAAVFGVLAGRTGYAVAFAVTGGLMIVSLGPVVRVRREAQGALATDL